MSTYSALYASLLETPRLMVFRFPYYEMCLQMDYGAEGERTIPSGRLTPSPTLALQSPFAVPLLFKILCAVH